MYQRVGNRVSNRATAPVVSASGLPARETWTWREVRSASIRWNGSRAWPSSSSSSWSHSSAASQAISTRSSSCRVIASSGRRSRRTSSSGNTCTGSTIGGSYSSLVRRLSASVRPPRRARIQRSESTRWDSALRPRGGRHLLRHLDLALEDLARRAHRKLVHEPDLPRVLVGGHLLLDVGLQLVLVDRLALLQHHRGAHLLAELVVRHADHGRLLDRRVLVQHLLDLARVDVVAATDDQVLLAVDDEEVAVLVHLGHVARAEPALLRDGLLVRVVTVPVALHDVVAADHDLADLALWDLVAVVVPHLHLDTLDRGADRAGLALLVGMVERGH